MRNANIKGADPPGHLDIRYLEGIVVKLATCKMGLDATKPVFGVSDKARLKLVPSVTETN